MFEWSSDAPVRFIRRGGGLAVLCGLVLAVSVWLVPELAGSPIQGGIMALASVVLGVIAIALVSTSRSHWELRVFWELWVGIGTIATGFLSVGVFHSQLRSSLASGLIVLLFVFVFLQYRHTRPLDSPRTIRLKRWGLRTALGLTGLSFLLSLFTNAPALAESLGTHPAVVLLTVLAVLLMVFAGVLVVDGWLRLQPEILSPEQSADDADPSVASD